MSEIGFFTAFLGDLNCSILIPRKLPILGTTLSWFVTSFSSGLEGSAKCHWRVTWLWLVGGCEDQLGCFWLGKKMIFVTNVRWNASPGHVKMLTMSYWWRRASILGVIDPIFRFFLVFFGWMKSLGGGFKYFLFSPLFGEDSHFG